MRSCKRVAQLGCLHLGSALTVLLATACGSDAPGSSEEPGGTGGSASTGTGGSLLGGDGGAPPNDAGGSATGGGMTSGGVPGRGPDDPYDMCSPASGTAPMGTVCCDGPCPGTHFCDGAGECGTAAECLPSPGCSLKYFKDRWYWFCPGPVDWLTATGHCNAISARALVRVESAEENAFLVQYLRGESWIGANDRSLEGDWRWSTQSSVDGTPFWSGDASGAPIEFRYSEWPPSEPSAGADEHCASIAPTTGEWADGPCSASMGYVCERTHIKDVCFQ